MRKVVWTMAALGLALSLASLSTGATSPAAQNPVSDALRSQWDTVKNYYLKSANQMPDDAYGFKPTPEVRSFGAIIAHVAGANYLICAGARGEKPPYTESYFEENAKTKADIVKAATDSVAYCDGAFSGATDANLGDMVDAAFSNKKQARASLLIMNVGHVNEHYGNLVTYFRLKKMVPPSSQKAGS
jgi:uncharacterized damage-inducible protein DinB